MRRTLTWTQWSAWKDYTLGAVSYSTRNCKLMCGKVQVATVVESTVPRYGRGQRCFMYAGPQLTRGVNVFRTAREFVRRFL